MSMAIGEAWKTRDKNKKKEVKKKKVVTKKKEVVKKENPNRIHANVETRVKKKENPNRIHANVETRRKFTDEFMHDMSDPLPVRKDHFEGRYRDPSMDSVKTKMVLAPHRNPTNKMIRVADRPGKKRKVRSEIPSHRMSSGGKLGINNSGQKLVQKLYSKGGKV